MNVWFALLVVPTLALADQAIAYAAVGWVCAHGQPFVLQAFHALFLAIAAAGTVPAFRLWAATRAAATETAQRQHFLAGLAVAAAALSVLVCAAMWMTTWVISPCVQ
ncbi:MAG: hypothetical protein JF606_06155 [Burkholderiales bacterium]|nr:hypothetical protein [Burkholderiales bacterium]